MDIHVDNKDRASGVYGQPTTPDLLLSRAQVQAVDFLERCAREMAPLAALTGPAGSGKTLCLNIALARRQSSGNPVIRVNNFVAGPLSLHRLLASSLGVAEASELSAEELEPVLRKALADAGQAEPPIVAVDDAQSLLPETLRYLCLLAGLRDAGRPLFRIWLAGRPGFTVRQTISVQFTLQAVTPGVAREIVEHRFEAAGLAVSEEVVHDFVQRGQGNLRTLDLLLRESVQHPKRNTLTFASRRRATPPDIRLSAGARPHGRSRRGSGGAWLVLPGLAVVAAACVGIAYHDNWFTAPTAAPGVAPGRLIPVVPARPPSVASVKPPPQAVAPTWHAAPAPVPPVAVSPPATAPASPPGTVASQPIPPARPPAAVEPPATAARIAPPQAPPALARVTPDKTERFRVYNIGPCHHGVCTHWSVLDLGRQQRSVASFDPAGLHLDNETMQRVREGSLDLLVTGELVRNGAQSPTLDASGLVSVVQHHGRPAAGPLSVDGSADPSALQSPQPGYLSLPAGEAPFGATASSPYQQGGQY